jgi:hypothetical protein
MPSNYNIYSRFHGKDYKRKRTCVRLNGQSGLSTIPTACCDARTVSSSSRTSTLGAILIYSSCNHGESFTFHATLLEVPAVVSIHRSSVPPDEAHFSLLHANKMNIYKLTVYSAIYLQMIIHLTKVQPVLVVLTLSSDITSSPA